MKKNVSVVKKIVFVLTALVAIVVIAINVLLSEWCFYFLRADVPNPLFIESTEHIRETLLELTPTGTSVDDVIRIIEDKGEKGEWSDLRGGSLNPLPWNYTHRFDAEKIIYGVIGEYKEANDWYSTCVDVAWEFDENSKLLDIAVKKYADEN
jgi:hypothetical protein